MKVKELKESLDLALTKNIIDTDDNIYVIVNEGDGWKPIMLSCISVPTIKKDPIYPEETKFLDAKIVFVKN